MFLLQPRHRWSRTSENTTHHCLFRRCLKTRAYQFGWVGICSEVWLFCSWEGRLRRPMPVFQEEAGTGEGQSNSHAQQPWSAFFLVEHWLHAPAHHQKEAENLFQAGRVCHSEVSLLVCLPGRAFCRQRQVGQVPVLSPALPRLTIAVQQ